MKKYCLLATLLTFSCTSIASCLSIVLENAWKVQDWSAMKEASTQAEPVCLDSYSAKLNLLRGYLALCYPDEQRLSVVEKLIEAASVQSIKHWRRLPQLISHAHVPLLQVWPCGGRGCHMLFCPAPSCPIRSWSYRKP